MWSRLNSAGTEVKNFFSEEDDYYILKGYQMGKLFLWQILACIVAACCAIALIAACSGGSDVVTSSTSSPTASPNSSECTSPVCVKQSYLMMRMQNRSVDPCDNFYEYACGGFSELTIEMDQYLKSLDLDQWLLEQNRKLIFEHVVAASSHPDYSALRKANILYTTCLSGLRTFERKEVIQDFFNKTLDSNLEILGNLDENKWNFQDAFMELSVRPFTNILLQFSWTSPKKKGGKSRLVISPGKVYLPAKSQYTNDPFIITEREYIDLIETAISQIAIDTLSYNDITRQKSHQFARDVVRFEENLITVDKVVIGDDGEEFRSGEVTVEELEEMAPEFHWQTILTEIYGEKVDSETPVVLTNAGYLYHLNELVNTTSNRTLKNALTWGYISNFLMSLGMRYTSDLATYLQIIKQATYPSPYSSVVDECQEMVEDTMPHVLNLIFLKHILQPKAAEEMEKLRDMQLSTIKNSFTKWLDRTSLDIFTNNTRSIGEEPLFSKWDLLSFDVDHYYVDFYPNTSIQDNVKHTKVFLKAKLQDRLRYISEEEPVILKPYRTAVHLDETKKLLHTPLGALQTPLYGSGLPNYINMASLGSIITEKWAEAFIWSDRSLTEAASLISLSDKLKLIQFDSCVVNSFFNVTTSSYDDKLSLVKVRVDISKNQLSQLKRLFYTLELAFQQFKNISSEKIELLPGFEPASPEQLFFLSFAQARCKRKEIESLTASKYKMAKILPEHIKINGALFNNKHFRNAFKCAHLDRGHMCSLLS